MRLANPRLALILILTALSAGCGGTGDRGPGHVDGGPMTAADSLDSGASAGDLLGEYYIVATSLNVRSAPPGPVIASAELQERVEVYEIREGWARISAPDAPARWVSLDYLSRSAPPSPEESLRKALPGMDRRIRP